MPALNLDVSKPADNELVSAFPGLVRDDKTKIRDFLATEHDVDSGTHKEVTIPPTQAATATATKQDSLKIKFQVSVWDATNNVAVTKEATIYATVDANNNAKLVLPTVAGGVSQKGSETVFMGNNFVDVTLPSAEADTDYLVVTNVEWDTTVFITNKTTSGFTINFGTGPAIDSIVYWAVIR